MSRFWSNARSVVPQRAALGLVLGALAWACSDSAKDPAENGPEATGGVGAATAGTTGGATANPPSAGGSSATGGVAPANGSGGTSMGGSVAGQGASPASVGGSPSAGLGGSSSMAGGAGTGATGVTGGSGGSNTSAGAGGSAGSAGASQSGSGGSAGSGTGNVVFEKPDGTIPNMPQPESSTNLPKDQWEKGIISPSLQKGHQINQSSVVNGYLLVGGNEEFWFYDVSNPASPRQLSAFTTPNRTGGEAETHSISYARYGNSFYAVTVGGRGIDTWDVTDALKPQHLNQLKITGINYGDYTEAVWGVSWQGQYIYVGATNNGIKVVDAADPRALRIVAEVPTSQYGGVSAGPVEAVGNVLVVMTPKESGGIATLDISNPVEPKRLASLSTDKAYIGAFHRRYAYLIGVKVWDVLSNPKSIGSGSSPIGSLGTEGAEYMAFSDDYMFLGHLRSEISGTPGASKIDVRDPRKMSVVNRIWGRRNLGDLNDDQFVFPMGNVVVIGDDQTPYPGWFIAVHQAQPDSKPPVVDTVIPNDASTGNVVTSRIGITFSDSIELATVNAASFIVRATGGATLAGKYGLRNGVVNFDPDEALQPGTTYEVVLPAGGIADLVGNTLANTWQSTFTTN